MKAKTELFPPDLAGLAESLKTLAHPARLAILQTLAERGACVCGEVVAVVPLAQATVSQHLKVLQEAGLIRGEVDGPRSCYCIDPAAVEALAERFAAYAESLRVSSPCTPEGDGCAC